MVIISSETRLLSGVRSRNKLERREMKMGVDEKYANIFHIYSH